MWIDSVIGRILRRESNRLIQLLQLCGHIEPHIKRFDKLTGVIDLKRLKRDWFAMASGVNERFFSDIGTI